MEFTGNKSIITPEGVFIIGTYDENGVPNAMNAAWGMQSDMGEITLMRNTRPPIILKRQALLPLHSAQPIPY